MKYYTFMWLYLAYTLPNAIWERYALEGVQPVRCKSLPR